MAEASITIVCDGCRPVSSLDGAHAARLADRLAKHPCRFSKRGIVSDEVASAYEQFKRRLLLEAAEAGYGGRLQLLELTSHHGFAFAVRQGLRATLATGAQHALVIQHDRAFCRRVPRRDFSMIMAHFAANPSCRYIGFPSGTSKSLALRTANQYKLHTLLAQRTYDLRPGLSLRPSVFWYDSNHLVDAAKALEIYTPYRNAPPGLLERLGGAGVGRFRLRRGDFTEERFGVEQRNLLVGLRHEPAECVRFFDWFGAYLLEELVLDLPQDGPQEGVHELAHAAHAEDRDESSYRLVDPHLVDKHGRVTYVDHIDARGPFPAALPSLPLPSTTS
jgi:hypothetical protein